MNDPEALLHYFDILLKESNFTKAAHELSISQPYLTQLIKRIEKKLGTQIINRDHAPFSLTKAGIIYYKYLENTAFNDEQLERELVPFTEPNKEIIKLGIDPSLGTFILPRLLPIFLRQNPNTSIQLSENSSRQNEANLLNDNIDCYIGQASEITSPNIDYVIKNDEQYYIVIPHHSSYFQSNKFILDPNEIDLKEILQAPMVLNTSESTIRHQINGLFQKFQVKPNIVLESKSIVIATELALHGVGLTISTANILTNMREKPINLLPIDKNLMYANFYIAIHKGKEVSSATQKLVDYFEQLNLDSNF